MGRASPGFKPLWQTQPQSRMAVPLGPKAPDCAALRTAACGKPKRSHGTASSSYRSDSKYEGGSTSASIATARSSASRASDGVGSGGAPPPSPGGGGGAEQRTAARRGGERRVCGPACSASAEAVARSSALMPTWASILVSRESPSLRG
eukprot:scaffold81681_cov60-Phaeocystis_antarctica.AAC.3